MSASGGAADRHSGAICIVTGELAGPDYNGGIGTSNRGLAIALSRAGFKVDILYTRVDGGKPFSARGTFENQVAAFARHGINLSCIYHDGRWNDWGAKSHHALQHILGHSYDVVFFDDTHGNGYLPALAKRTGLAALKSTTIVVVAHSATQWIFDANQSGLRSVEDVRLMEMERRSIELADVLIAPSAYILARYRGYGWSFPSRVVVQPNIVLDEVPPRRQTRHADIREFVFFGRLEDRKGLWTLCDAIDRIKYRIPSTAITFLGKTTLEDGISTGAKLVRRMATWPFPASILSTYDRDQALDYLRGSNRLAVMPSREDNSPSVILECLHNEIPFIASSGSGGEELIAPQSQAEVLFRPAARDLADKLLAVRSAGIDRASPAFTFSENADRYLSLVKSLVEQPSADLHRSTPVSERFKTAVIGFVPERLQPHRAADMIEAAARQYDETAEISVVAESEAAATAIEAILGTGRFHFYGPSSYARLTDELALGPDRVVCLCYVPQLPSPEWLVRAADALARDRTLGAATGMAADEPHPLPDDLPAYVSHSAKAPWAPARFLVGNAAALDTMSLETNAGVAAIQSRLLNLVASSAPFDVALGRIRRATDWIHEILMRLDARGHRFELLPDLPQGDANSGEGFEVFRLASQMHATITDRLGYAPGSEAAILSRLAIDFALKDERTAEARELLAAAAPTLAEAQWRTPSSNESEINRLARLASAVGQIDLATELVANEVYAADFGDLSLESRLEMASRTVSVTDLVANGAFRQINLEKDWSFNPFPKENGFDLHANPANEGRAAIEFDELDLSEVDAFVVDLRLPQDANPVRARIELIPGNAWERTSWEVSLLGGETKSIHFVLPDAVRGKCVLALSVEMVNQLDATLSAHVRWTGPRFICTVPVEA